MLVRRMRTLSRIEDQAPRRHGTEKIGRSLEVNPQHSERLLNHARLARIQNNIR